MTENFSSGLKEDYNEFTSKLIRRFKIGDEVIVTKKESENFDKVGEVWKVRINDDHLKISVSFDGSIFNYLPEDIDLA